MSDTHPESPKSVAAVNASALAFVELIRREVPDYRWDLIQELFTTFSTAASRITD